MKAVAVITTIPSVKFHWTNSSVVQRKQYAWHGDSLINYRTTVIIQKFYPLIPMGVENPLRESVIKNKSLCLLAQKYCQELVGPTVDIAAMTVHQRGDLFEAFISAIWKEQGVDAAEAFLCSVLRPLIKTNYKRISRNLKAKVKGTGRATIKPKHTRKSKSQRRRRNSRSKKNQQLS